MSSLSVVTMGLLSAGNGTGETIFIPIEIPMNAISVSAEDPTLEVNLTEGIYSANYNEENVNITLTEDSLEATLAGNDVISGLIKENSLEASLEAETLGANITTDDLEVSTKC